MTWNFGCCRENKKTTCAPPASLCARVCYTVLRPRRPSHRRAARHSTARRRPQKQIDVIAATEFRGFFVIIFFLFRSSARRGRRTRRRPLRFKCGRPKTLGRRIACTASARIFTTHTGHVPRPFCRAMSIAPYTRDDDGVGICRWHFTKSINRIGARSFRVTRVTPKGHWVTVFVRLALQSTRAPQGSSRRTHVIGKPTRNRTALPLPFAGIVWRWLMDIVEMTKWCLGCLYTAVCWRCRIAAAGLRP